MDNRNNDTSVFSEIWGIIRDFYAPTMTAPEAARKAVVEMNRNGHEAFDMGKRFMMIDLELYEIRKHRNWSHFELIHHGIRI